MTTLDIRQQPAEQTDEKQCDHQRTVTARTLAEAFLGYGRLVISLNAHMTSGAETPNNARPLRITCRVARLKLSRASRSASSGTSTRCSL